MASTEQVLEFVQKNGPLLPSQVATAVGTNILFSSAMLSELSDNGKVKISALKVGGSPLYYVEGQEAKLEQYIAKLGEKPEKAVLLLKEKKILRDAACEPVVRVALRESRDFARPIEVIVGEKKELFWKWYGLSAQETEDAVREALGISAASEVQNETASVVEEPASAPFAPVTAPAAKDNMQKKQEEETAAGKNQKEEDAEKKKESKQEQKAARKQANDDFLDKVSTYFREHNIEILEKNVLKKNSDIDFLIRVPNPVGSVKYYCKAKNKKKVTDGDISTAYMQGQMRKLPVIVLSTGELSKKAHELLTTDLNINFKTI